MKICPPFKTEPAGEQQILSLIQCHARKSYQRRHIPKKPIGLRML